MRYDGRMRYEVRRPAFGDTDAGRGNAGTDVRAGGRRPERRYGSASVQIVRKLVRKLVRQFVRL